MNLIISWFKISLQIYKAQTAGSINWSWIVTFIFKLRQGHFCCSVCLMVCRTFCRQMWKLTVAMPIMLQNKIDWTTRSFCAPALIKVQGLSGHIFPFSYVSDLTYINLFIYYLITCNNIKYVILSTYYYNTTTYVRQN